MRKFCRFLFLLLIVNFCFGTSVIHAIVDPLSVPNNRIGVHILDTGEVIEAAKLVNSSGGSWGYVTIPLRIDDRNKEKWTAFFTSCTQNKLIPIIRLSTYFNRDNWVTPTEYDLVDFANFLTDMPWPVKNRYIVMFNEPNHGKEWGNQVSPKDYAALIISAKDIFKSRSSDFFLISSGLDMSAPSNHQSLDALLFYKQMTKYSPSWYEAIDGLSVHAYPNPGFMASPFSKTRFGITSYRYETNLLRSLGYKPKPIFITETGFLGKNDYYSISLSDIWLESNIVAITPFVLFAGAGDFTSFSLLDTSHQPKISYRSLYEYPKIAGSPLLNSLPPPNFTDSLTWQSTPSASLRQPNFFQRFLGIFSSTPTLTIGHTVIPVELAIKEVSRIKGLSDRKSLPADSGMLFIFDSSVVRSFWMKDMNFPLDMIWIDNNEIVKIDENIPFPKNKLDPPKVINSEKPVNWVLEVNTGFVSNNSISVGNRVVLNSP